MTGLSRRALLALGVLVILGIGASTLATVGSARGEAGCPYVDYGCATFERGEPVRIGALFPEAHGLARNAVGLVVQLRGGTFGGRPLEVLGWGTGCIPEGGARGARELATDAPDEPPVLAVVGGTCSAAATPAAQILGDSGITLVSPNATELPPTTGRPRWYLHLPPVDPHEAATYEAAYAQRYGPSTAVAIGAAIAADRILDAAEALARPGPDGSLLVPRTPLRDALLDAGLLRGG